MDRARDCLTGVHDIEIAKARKAELFAKVVDGGGATATGITADDIRDLST